MTDQIHHQLSDREQRICATLMADGRIGQWRSAPSIAKESHVTVSRVPGLLQGLVGLGWAETRVDGASRKYRLTVAGLQYLRSLLRDEQAIVQRQSADELRKVAERIAPVGENDTNGQPWSLSRLKQRDPKLAAIVERKLATGDYE